SATALDQDQGLTVGSGIPTTGSSPYSWTWLVKVGAGSFGSSTGICSTPSGSGASGGAAETCSVAASTLTAGTTYAFELQVTDAATIAEVTTSLSSATVSVSTPLLPPSTPTVTATSIDQDQSLGVSANLPSSGTPGYVWTWEIKQNTGAYAPATQCSVNGGSGGGAGALETCSVSPGALSSGSTYTFELYVHDSATVAEVQTSSASASVAVAGALVAGAISPAPVYLDNGQSITLTAGSSGGTGPWTFQWFTGSSCTSPIGGATSNTFVAGGSVTTTYYYQVTDSAATPESRCSAGDRVAVSPALTQPATPSVSVSALDADQTSSASGSIPTTGTSPYSWQWWVSVNGNPFAAATQCTANAGSGGAAGAAVTCSMGSNALSAGSSYAFELQVTDGATTAESLTSSSSSAISVSSALANAPTPIVSATRLDQDQVVTISSSIPTSGTPTYTWSWEVSQNSNPYALASSCSTDGGTGTAGGTAETCTIASGLLSAGSSYVFELEVADSATNSERTFSAPSSSIAVASALVAGPSSPFAPLLDLGQSVTLSVGASGGTSTWSYQWFTGASCTSPIGGATATTYVASPTVTTTYYYQVTDSASSAEVRCSPGNNVAVSPALTAPSAPVPNAAVIDDNQTLKVSGFIPTTGTAPYSWSWRVSVGGGPFAATTQCAVNSGAGAVAGTGETCLIVGNSLSVGSNYAFELEVSDGATTPESQTSGSSSATAVSSTLTPPASPTVSGTYLDTDQALTVSGALSSTGTSPYAWAWLISINGGSDVPATQCATNSGTGGAPSASETCAITGGVLAAGTTYSFELSVTDSASSPETSPSTASATVFAAAPLTAAAIAPSSPTLDAGQSVTLTAGRTGGIAPFSFQWYLGASCTTPIAGAISSTYLAAPASTTSYYYAVVDSASTPESACSAGDTVGVNAALTAPGAPTISDAYLDADQAMTVSGTIPSTGTGPYAWAWLLPLSSGAVVLATQCTVSSGKGAVAGALETCAIPGGALTAGSTYNFELTVNDS
ncbi:MAG: hypothetical protein KGJ23_16325, partial [Euryarchaeota archaeon]|nr:hypothetical protein [Euryarchaeota archaeon]